MILMIEMTMPKAECYYSDHFTTIAIHPINAKLNPPQNQKIGLYSLIYFQK